MTIRAGLYARVSEDRDETRLSVTRQLEDCRAHAARHGWEIGDEYIDNGISASDPRVRRPQYERLLDDIAAGWVQAVVVWDIDRLVRRPMELEQFFEVCDKAGLTTLASIGGDIDLGTGDGVVTARIRGAIAAEEVRKSSRRISRKHRQLAEAGRPAGGKRPYGFGADHITHRDHEVALIREAAAHVLAGGHLTPLVRDWNQRGVATSSGVGSWTFSSLRSILINPRNAGVRMLNGVEVATAVWEPIFDRATLDALTMVLTHPTRQAPRPAQPYPLRGFVTCGLCGAPLRGNARRGGYRDYKCSVQHGGCGRILINAERLENEVMTPLLAWLDTPAVVAVLGTRRGPHARELASLVRRISDDEHAKRRIADDHYVNRTLDRASFLRLTGAIDTRLAQGRSQLATEEGIAAIGGLIGHARQRWPQLTRDVRRRILAALLADITITPGVRGRWDPRRIRTRWQPGVLVALTDELSHHWSDQQRRIALTAYLDGGRSFDPAPQPAPLTVTRTLQQRRARRRELQPVGKAEIVERLGISHQLLNRWAATNPLPEPAWTVSRQPAWDWTDIEQWANAQGSSTSTKFAPHRSRRD